LFGRLVHDLRRLLLDRALHSAANGVTDGLADAAPDGPF
jgi:hypothetical protein